MQEKIAYHQNKIHEASRKQEREDFLITKRMQSLIPQSPQIMIPQFILESKIDELNQIHHMLSQTPSFSISKQLTKQYFLQSFGKALNIQLKLIILRLSKLVAGWDQQQYELAFNLCQHQVILEDIIDYIEEINIDQNQSIKSDIKQTNQKISNAEKKEIIFKLLKEPAKQLSGDTISKYCYLLLFYSNPAPYNSQTITLLLSQLDVLLKTPQLVNACLLVIDKFLQASTNLNQYCQIIKMNNFHIIVEECQNKDYEIHSLAYEICIDILPSNPDICQQLVLKYDFISLINKFLDHPFLHKKTLWAISNLVIVESILPQMLNVITKLFSQQIQFYFKTPPILLQINFIIINIIYTTSQSNIDQILPLIPKFIPFIDNMFQIPLSKSDLHKNLLHAIARSIIADKRVKAIYVKYGIDKRIQQFQKKFDKFESQLIEGLLDAFIEEGQDD